MLLADTSGTQASRQGWYSTIMVSLISVCCLLTMAGCRPTVVGLTQPSGYRVLLPEASQTERLRPLTLTVRLTDAYGTPVDDVPVHFRIPPAWAAVADVTPAVVITQRGHASAAFRASTAGQMEVEVSVEDRTETVRIAVLGETPRF
jgi:hypothetical protein